MPKRPKLLFVTYGGGHARMLRPVVEEVLRADCAEVVLLALTSGRKEFEGVKCRTIGYKDFFDAADVRKTGEALIDGLSTVIDYEESVAYLGQNYQEMLQDLGEQESQARYKSLGRQSFLPVKAMSTILRLEAPDLVVTTNSPRSEKAALIAARDLGIKSLAIIDLFAIRGLEWLRRNDIASRLCVLSGEVKASLVAAGRAEDSVVVTGNPAFDPLVNEYRQNKYSINESRRTSKFTVLWASQVEPEYSDHDGKVGDPELPRRIEKRLQAIFAKHRDWRLVVRNHPNEPPRSYPDFIRVSTQDEPIAELLARVDLVITLTSTLGLQGAIFGARFVTLDMSVLSELMPYAKSGLSTGVDSLDQLEVLLSRFAAAPSEDWQTPYSIPDATQRVTRQIHELLGIKMPLTGAEQPIRRARSLPAGTAETQPTATRVLAVTYGGGHANIIFPLVENLIQRGIDTQLLALTSAGPQAAQRGLPYKAYRDYRHLVDYQRARKLGKKLALDMHNDSIGLNHEESISYLGINLLENIETLGEDLAIRALDLAGRHSFLPIEFFRRIICEGGFTHVLTTNSPSSEKAALIAAYQLGRKSFRIDDLFGVPILHGSLIKKMGAEIYRQTTGRIKITPTQSCFLSDVARDNFIKLQELWDITGVCRANSTVTGQPIFDEIDDVVRSRPKIDLFPGRGHLPTLTWAHESGHVDNDELVDMLQDCFRKRGDEYNFVIKLRPSIDPEAMRRVLNRFDNRRQNLRVIHSELDANILIWNSTIVIGQVSTMLTQAAYMGKPVIVADPGGLRGGDPLVESKLASVVKTPRDIYEAVVSLSQTDSDRYLEFLRGRETINFKSGGTENICNLLQRYL